MAIAHFTLRARTTSGRQTATRTVAYLKRERDYAPQQDVGYLRRERADVSGRDDLVWQQTYHLPAWAENDPYRFFEASAAYERMNGRWALAMEVALPRELTREQQVELIEDFVHSQLHQKPALVVMHEPRGTDGPQPHIHILMSPRTLDGLDRTMETYFKRANREHPELGGALKDPYWSLRQAPVRTRTVYTDLVNAALERAGHAARIDPRSLSARGIDREAESKQGWQADGQARRAAISAQRGGTLTEEHQAAVGYWETRKKVLGVDIHDREALVARTREWARDTMPGKQIKRADLPTQALRLRGAVQAHQDLWARLELAARKDERTSARGQQPSWDDVEKVQGLVQRALSATQPGLPRLPHIGLRLPEEAHARGRVEVRLRDDDDGYQR